MPRTRSGTRVAGRGLAVLAAAALMAPAAVLLPTLPGGGGSPKPVATKITDLDLTAAVRAAAAGATPATVLTGPSSTAGYQTVGVTWDAGTPAGTQLDVQVRTHDRGGAWSAWTALGTSDADDATTGKNVRPGTDPMWVGPSDGVQVSVRAVRGTLPTGLRAELVDPGSSSYDAQAGSLPPASAAAAAPQPRILPRAAWGADESKRRGTPEIQATVLAGVLHHTVDRNGYTAAQVPAMIRGDYAYHLSRGWNDIGYNFLVDRFGRIWEGRYGGVDKAVLGAHAGGFNTDTFGVAMIGDYDTTRPSAASLEAVAQIMAWKLDLYHRDPLGHTLLTSSGGGTSRYPAGTVVDKPDIMGHRDVGQTACPGQYLYPELPAIRRRAAQIMAAGLFSPQGQTVTRAYRSGGVSVAATSLATQSWRLTVTDLCRRVIVGQVSGRSSAGTRFVASWNGKTPTGNWARPGAYSVVLQAAAGSVAARSVQGTLLLLPPAPAPVPTGTASTGTGGYVPVPPTQLLDTRYDRQGAIGPGGRLDLPVLGYAGIPTSGVSAVALQVTATCTTSSTSVQAQPAGQPNWGGSPLIAPRAGLTRTSTIVLPVGASGRVSLTNAAGVTDLIVAAVGYEAAGGEPLVGDRTRIYDSRQSGGPLGNGASRTITLPASLSGVAAGSVGAMLADVSVLGPTAGGQLFVRPGPATTGAAPTTIWPAGADHDLELLVRPSGGKITLTVAGPPVNLLIDVRGVFPASGGTGADLTAVRPLKLLDSRTTGGRLADGSSRTLSVVGGTGVPADATAVLLNVVGINPSGAARIVAWPAGQAAPGDSDLRIGAGDIRSNLALVPIGGNGQISVGTFGAATDVALELVGWYR